MCCNLSLPIHCLSATTTSIICSTLMARYFKHSLFAESMMLSLNGSFCSSSCFYCTTTNHIATACGPSASTESTPVSDHLQLPFQKGHDSSQTSTCSTTTLTLGVPAASQPPLYRGVFPTCPETEDQSWLRLKKVMGHL